MFVTVCRCHLRGIAGSGVACAWARIASAVSASLDKAFVGFDLCEDLRGSAVVIRPRHRTFGRRVFGTEGDNGSCPGMGHSPLPSEETRFWQDDRRPPGSSSEQSRRDRITPCGLPASRGLTGYEHRDRRICSHARAMVASCRVCAMMLPEGLLYVPGFLTEAEERDVLAVLATVELHPYVLHDTPSRRLV